MTVTFHTLAKQNPVFPSAKKNTKQTFSISESTLTKHVFDNEHSMDWTNAKILDFELDATKHRLIESYFMNQVPNTMNDNQNDKFPSIYSTTLLQKP